MLEKYSIALERIELNNGGLTVIKDINDETIKSITIGFKYRLVMIEYENEELVTFYNLNKFTSFSIKGKKDE